MINVLRKIVKRMILLSVIVCAVSLQYGINAAAAEVSVSDNTVSENEMPEMSVSDNSVVIPAEDGNNEETKDKDKAEANKVEDSDVKPENVPVEQQISSDQMQTVNYRNEVLTDWQKITEALSTLTPEALTDTSAEAPVLMLQVQNVTNIPADIKNGLATTDGSGRTKLLHCNIGYGAALVFNGSMDNSGFNGISNAGASVSSEKRGKRSMATTVRFASHENLGTVASLHVNLPQCDEGTKVSVYAETISVDANGNVTVGENVCIGNTKADENGNVEVLIQSTANYMFVYKGAKE